jgi:6-pyruvoyltetrahydropterin/6-carboxytetrahydropterin synthase
VDGSAFWAWHEGHEATEDTVVMGIMDKRYVFPREDCVLLPIPTTTAEHLAALVLNRLMERVTFPKTVHGVRIGVDEGHGQGAWTEWNLLDHK